MGGDGLGEGLRGFLVGLEEPDLAVAIGLDGGDVIRLVAEGGLVVGDFVAEVAEPDDLVADAGRVVAVGGGYVLLGVGGWKLRVGS